MQEYVPRYPAEHPVIISDTLALPTHIPARQPRRVFHSPEREQLVDDIKGKHCICYPGDMLPELTLHPMSSFPIALQGGGNHATYNKTGIYHSQCFGCNC